MYERKEDHKESLTDALLIESHEAECEHVANRSGVQRLELLERGFGWHITQHGVYAAARHIVAFS